MTTKLTTLAQVAALREGSTVKRFPSNSDIAPQEIFDEKNLKNIDTFKVRAVNGKNGMVLLITSGDALFSSPVDQGRLFISEQDLVSQKIWWV